MINSWRIPFRERFPNVPIYELLCASNLLYRMLHFYENRAIRSSLGEKEWENIIRVEKAAMIDYRPEKLGRTLFWFLALLILSGC